MNITFVFLLLLWQNLPHVCRGEEELVKRQVQPGLMYAMTKAGQRPMYALQGGVSADRSNANLMSAMPISAPVIANRLGYNSGGGNRAVLNRYAEDGISSAVQQQQQPQLPIQVQSPLFSPVQFSLPQQQQQLLLNRMAVDPRMLSPALGLANQQQKQQELALLRALEQRQLQQRMLNSAAGTSSNLSPMQKKTNAFRLSGRRGPMKNRVLVRKKNSTQRQPVQRNRLQMGGVVAQQQQQSVPVVLYQQPQQLAQQLALQQQQQQQQQQLAMQQLQAASGNIIQQIPSISSAKQQQDVSTAVKTASVIAQLAAANRMLRAKLAMLEKNNGTSMTTPGTTIFRATTGEKSASTKQKKNSNKSTEKPPDKNKVRTGKSKSKSIRLMPTKNKMRERPIIKESTRRSYFADSREKESSMSSSSEEEKRRLQKGGNRISQNHKSRNQGLNSNRQGLSRSKDSELDQGVLQEDEENVDLGEVEEKGEGEIREDFEKVDPVEGKVARPKEVVQNDEEKKLKDDLIKHRKEQEEVRRRQQKAIEQQKVKVEEKRHQQLKKARSSHGTEKSKHPKNNHKMSMEEYDKSVEGHVRDTEGKSKYLDKDRSYHGGQDYADDQYDDEEGSEEEEKPSGAKKREDNFGGDNKMLRHRHSRDQNRDRKRGLQEFNRANNNNSEEPRRRDNNYNKNRNLRESDE